MANLSQIPPWLDINPRDFTAASEAGARLGQQRYEADQSAGLERSRLAMQGQQIAQSAAQHQQEMQVQKQRDAVDAEVKKQEMAMKIQEAQQKISAQQQYQQAVAGGMDPMEAYMKFGPMMGETAGVGTMAAEKMRSQTVPIPTLDANGNQNGFTINGVWHQIRPTKAEVPGGLTDEQEKSQAVLERRIEAIDKSIDKLDPKMDADRIKTLEREKDSYESKIDSILPTLGGGAPSPSSGDYDSQLKQAQDAIARGAPKDQVYARFKQQTGKEFPTSTPAPGAPAAAPQAQVPQSITTGIPEIDQPVQDLAKARIEQQKQNEAAMKKQKIASTQAAIKSIQDEIAEQVRQQKVANKLSANKPGAFESTPQSDWNTTTVSPVERAQRVKAAQAKLAELQITLRGLSQ